MAFVVTGLPSSAPVYLYCYTNSTTQQKVVVSQAGRPDVVFTGSGPNNTPMQPASAIINTPATPNYSVTISIFTMKNGSWIETDPDGTIGKAHNVGLALVSAEEVKDATWNAAVAFFMWYKNN
jgi:Fucose-binding lectin II (PA-IIL)